MLAIGAAAGAASFTHVHDVAAGHGQAGWLAWADAVVLELMSVASGLEIRRRKRVHGPVVFPVVVLAVAVSLSLSAQVVDAEASPIGWITAAIPALGFLVMVKIALAQTPVPSVNSEVLAPAPDEAMEGGPAVIDAAGSARTSDTGQVAVLPGVATQGRGMSATPHTSLVDVSSAPLLDSLGTSTLPHDRAPVRAIEPRAVEALMPAARALAEVVHRDGRRVSRQALARALRAEGHAVSNALVSAVLHALKAEAAEGQLDSAALRRRYGPGLRGSAPPQRLR
ncbi:MAG TPA: hypothetical protein VI248_06570 [Kineosporiaceae bacterium]